MLNVVEMILVRNEHVIQKVQIQTTLLKITKRDPSRGSDQE